MNRRVVISGCSGGGKSTLLAALATYGFATVAEPGRRIVREELASGGAALPWDDPVAFARRALAVSLADLEATDAGPGWTFFDRSWIDAAAALDHLTGEANARNLGAPHHYHDTVFLTPPWIEIFAGDSERRHDLDEAVAEYERLCEVYPALGYRTVILPRTSLDARIEALLAHLGL